MQSPNRGRLGGALTAGAKVVINGITGAALFPDLKSLLAPIPIPCLEEEIPCSHAQNSLCKRLETLKVLASDNARRAPAISDSALASCMRAEQIKWSAGSTSFKRAMTSLRRIVDITATTASLPIWRHEKYHRLRRNTK